MFQFGEILTLAIFVVALIYLLTNRGRILGLAALRPLVGPFLLIVASWAFTVVEGIPLVGEGVSGMVFWQDSAPAVAQGNAANAVLNLLEHLCFAASALWMLVAVWREAEGIRGAPG